MNVLRKIFVNTGLQILGKLSSILLGFISISILTRYLGITEYGKFSLIFAYLSFFSILSDFGLNLYIVKELQNKENRKRIIGTFFWIKLLFIINSTLISLLILYLFPYSQDIKVGIIIASIAVAISGLTSFGNSIFQSDLRLDLVTASDQISKIFTVILIILFVVLKYSLNSFIFAVLFGNLISLLYTYYFINKKFQINYYLNKKIVIPIITKTSLIGLTSVFSFLYFKSDTLILSLFRSNSDVGIYSVSYKILENLILIWGFYMASVFPLLSKFNFERNYELQKKMVFTSIKIAICLSTIIILISIYFAPLIIQIIAGKNFMNSIYPFRIMVFALPFLFINNIVFNLMLARNRIKIIIYSLGILFLINLILNLIFIPQYSYIASSFITVISEVILFSTYIFFYIKLQNNRDKYET